MEGLLITSITFIIFNSLFWKLHTNTIACEHKYLSSLLAIRHHFAGETSSAIRPKKFHANEVSQCLHN